MNAEEYLKGLNEHDPVFEIDTEYEYTEQQLINFAERYHQKQLKLLRTGVVGGSCSQLIADIEKLSRYDIYGTETEGSVEVEHCNDGDNIDADELYKILDNYR